MRRRTRQQQKGAELAWFIAGFLSIQLTLGIGVDQFWPAIRDPEVEQQLRGLWQHRELAPTRPLVVALGSSRTKFGFRADRLNQTAGKSGPLVYNLAIPASGPLFQQIVLRRLLAEGLRPQLAFIEVTPLFLSRRCGTPLEEHWLDTSRLDANEVLSVCPYYHQLYKLLCPWMAARLLPLYHHHAKLRDSLRLDRPADAIPGNGRTPPPENFGWQAVHKPARPATAPPECDRAFEDNNLGARPARALRDLLANCRREGIAVVLVITPESSAFRNSYCAAYRDIDAYLGRLAVEFGVPLYDARTWVDDEGFADGHHLCVQGADQFTERFEREVFRPRLGQLYSARGRSKTKG